ncbi:ATP-binding protein [Bacteroides cellulosilyticus]|uniref:ATP-binding protein n=1 Tax=Bacteroides cellulosilyticus TaxID=246787 RepID=UPI00101E2222|nr:ATP-binding protein [Bacteroides cellulosilyticus]
MKFYNREKEIAELTRIQELAFAQNSRMVVLTGRRRIGKTSLIKRALKDTPMLYFFIGRKAESVLVAEFVRQVRETFSVFVPEGMTSFSNLMQYLFEIGKGRSFSIVIDEFQEFYNINPSIFSDLQNLWDTYRQDTHINLVVSGSVYSMMQKIFTDHSEPLFGRADNILHLHPFKLEVLKQIMEDYAPGYSRDDLLALYAITGGIPKYVELLCDNGVLTVERMYRFIFSEMSPFTDEGRNLLITEFGKNYGTYFSVLLEIANGHRTQGEIEAKLGGLAIGGHLSKLENVYNLIVRERPVFAKPGSKKNVRYVIHDNFLNFWFKYIERNRSYIELQNYDDLFSLAMDDYPTYSGKILEKYFRQKLAEAGGFKEIGGWWEAGNSVRGKVEAFEINIVALCSKGRQALIAEVKRNPRNYNHKLFMEKVEHLRQKEMTKYRLETKLFSLEDM